MREHRGPVLTDLTPRIGETLADQLPRFYAMAREDAGAGMRDDGGRAAADALPTSCPYTLGRITGDWWP